MKSRRLMIAATGVLVATSMMPTAALAQSPPPKPTPKSGSLERQLLEDLDRQLLEGLPAGSKTPPRERASVAGPGGDSASQNPLAKIAGRMRAVESRIAQHDVSAQTQHEQQEIAKELAALLAQAQNQRSGSGNQGKGAGRGSDQPGTGSGNPIAGPPRDSTNRIERGTKEQAETTDVKDLMRRVWGHLPDKVRDQMQAALSERFLPKYERLIEDYYKRLAEERPSGQ